MPPPGPGALFRHALYFPRFPPCLPIWATLRATLGRPWNRVPNRFYLTTAIDYVNGRPHLGHAYEKVLADALARFHRQRGDATFFLTGTDEHGQKIARAAEAAGKTPRAFVDELVPTFTGAWKALGVSYDKFIRTTDPRHELAVQELFRRLHDARSPKTGEPVLFEDYYEGLYCEGCEGVQAGEGSRRRGPLPDPRDQAARRCARTTSSSASPSTTRRCSSTSRQHPDFIQPDYRRNEVLNVISDGLAGRERHAPQPAVGHRAARRDRGRARATRSTCGRTRCSTTSRRSAGRSASTRCGGWREENETGGTGAAREDEFQHLDGQGQPGCGVGGHAQPRSTPTRSI